jgi:hypothetical protein
VDWVNLAEDRDNIISSNCCLYVGQALMRIKLIYLHSSIIMHSYNRRLFAIFSDYL